MKNGDLSNEAPKRLLVNSDVFTIMSQEITRKYFVLPRVKKHVEFDRIMLSHLYMIQINTGLTFELISYSLDQDQIDLLHAELDRMGTNPFRYATAYKSPEKLIGELPYRPEVFGVVDVPSRKLMYGHWSYDIR